jgi:hypothetical protein
MPAVPAVAVRVLLYKLAIEKINASVKKLEAFLFISLVFLVLVLQVVAEVVVVEYQVF